MATYTQSEIDYLIAKAEHEGWKRGFKDCADMSGITLKDPMPVNKV